jgi:hypothetical protein
MFLNVGYGIHSVGVGAWLMARFLNHLDAWLLYVRGYHCGYEMVVFTHANPFTNHDDYFPLLCFVHIVCF